MPITKIPGRQYPSVATAIINFDDTTSGTAAAAIELPVGAIVISGSVDRLTAFNSATSDVLVVGDATTANRYMASTTIATTGRLALVPTGFTTTPTQRNVNVTWTGVGTAPTAGQVRLVVEYIVDGREEHTIG